MNIIHTISDNYLNDDNKNLIDNTTLYITTTWYKNQKIKELLTFNRINFGWLLEVDLHTNLIDTITTFLLLLKIKENRNPKLVIISNDLLEMAQIIFLHSKINVLETTKIKQRFYSDFFPVKYNIGSVSINLVIPRKYFFTLRKYYEKLFIPFVNKLFAKRTYKNDSIILLEFNPAQYDEFLRCLSEKNRNVFLLNRRRVAIWNFKSFNIVRKTRCIPITYEQFLDKSDKREIKILISDIMKKLDLLLSDQKLLADIFSICNYSFWNYLGKYFKDFCKERFEEAIYEMFASRKLLATLKPSLILHFYEVTLQEKILINEARKQNIDSILIQHGTPPVLFPNLAKLNPIQGSFPLYNDKKMAVWSNLVKEYTLKNGMKEENIIVAGSLRHDSYFKMKTNTNYKKGIILVALGQMSALNVDVASIANYERYEKCLEIICKTLKKITDRKKVAKLHPGPMHFNTVIVEPVIRSIDPSINIVVEADLGKLISSADVVITLGFTTFILDSNIFQKPVMTIVYDPLDFLSMSGGASETFKHTEDVKFEKYLNDLLTDNKTREENIKKGTEFVNAYLVNHGCASEYLAKKITE
jgi:hypothetical protein